MRHLFVLNAECKQWTVNTSVTSVTTGDHGGPRHLPRPQQQAQVTKILNKDRQTTRLFTFFLRLAHTGNKCKPNCVSGDPYYVFSAGPAAPL